MMLETEASDDNKKNKKIKRSKRCDDLIEVINTGIDVYQYSNVSDETFTLISQRIDIKEILKKDPSFTELKEQLVILKNIDPRIAELEWRYENSEILAEQKVVDELIETAFDDHKDDIKKMLCQYQKGSFYVLHKNP